MGSIFFDISLSDIFLHMSPQARETKAKINKWDHRKLKTCSAKETINKTRRQLTKWEKIFANHIADKGLIPQIYKEIIQFNNNNKTKQPDFKKGTGAEQTFFQRRQTVGQQAYEKNVQHH